VTWSQQQSENERQQIVNDFECWIVYNPMAVLWHLLMIEELEAFVGNIVLVNTATPQNKCQQSVNRASTERQQSINRVSTILGVVSFIIQRLCYGIYALSCYWTHVWVIQLQSISLHLKMSVHRAPTEHQQLYALHLV